MLKILKTFIKDENGAVTTVELIGYTVLIGGAAALVGFGLSAAYRGLTGSIVQEIKEADPNN